MRRLRRKDIFAFREGSIGILLTPGLLYYPFLMFCKIIFKYSAWLDILKVCNYLALFLVMKLTALYVIYVIIYMLIFNIVFINLKNRKCLN